MSMSILIFPPNVVNSIALSSCMLRVSFVSVWLKYAICLCITSDENVYICSLRLRNYDCHAFYICLCGIQWWDTHNGCCLVSGEQKQLTPELVLLSAHNLRWWPRITSSALCLPRLHQHKLFMCIYISTAQYKWKQIHPTSKKAWYILFRWSNVTCCEELHNFASVSFWVSLKFFEVPVPLHVNNETFAWWRD